jgi:hypothetical protein
MGVILVRPIRPAKKAVFLQPPIMVCTTWQGAACEIADFPRFP